MAVLARARLLLALAAASGALRARAATTAGAPSGAATRAAAAAALRAKGGAAIANALYAPCEAEVPPTAARVVRGELPADLPPGFLLRVGPNPAPEDHARTRGTTGFLDHDGMVHCVTFAPADGGVGARGARPPPAYARRWVRTDGRRRERARGEPPSAFFKGTLGVAPGGLRMLLHLAANALAFGRAVKDTANTALRAHGGKLLALMEQARPSELALTRDGDVRTVASATDLDGTVPDDPVTGGALGAHGRACPRTGEYFCVTYDSSGPPFARVDVFAPGSCAARASRGLGGMRAPVMVHDCELTREHVLVLELPLTIRPLRALANRFPVEYEPGLGGRIGLVPRRGGEVVWVEVEACVVLHAVHARADPATGHVRLVGCRAEPATPQSFITQFSPAFLYEWVLDPKSGRCVREGYLNSERVVEFPTLNPADVGGAAAAAYLVSIGAITGAIAEYRTPQESILLDGFVKMALADDEEGGGGGARAGDVLGQYALPAGAYAVSEPTFVPAVGAERAGGDAGYVLQFVSRVSGEGGGARRTASELHVVDARDPSAGPVAVVALPGTVPYGLHSCFVPWDYFAHEDADERGAA